MPTRIGFYTGKLYDSATNVSDIKECCQILNYKEPVLDNEELVIRKRKELHERCIGCNACEEAKRGGVKSILTRSIMDEIISKIIKSDNFLNKGKYTNDDIRSAIGEVLKERLGL